MNTGSNQASGAGFKAVDSAQLNIANRDTLGMAHTANTEAGVGLE